MPDLAIGVPGDFEFPAGRAGAVLAIVARPSRPPFVFSRPGTGTAAQRWTQADDGALGRLGVGERFGSAIASGDFDNDGADDLAISDPLEIISGNVAAGAVSVVYGSTGGLITTGQQFFNQDTVGVPGGPERDDQFGHALVAGNFNCDAYDDLAIGVPLEDIGSFADAGSVTVLYGSAAGLAASSDDWFQSAPGMAGGSEPGDRFGWALASGDFDGNGCDDLAIGVPGEDGSGNTPVDAGAVQVLFGTPSGLTSSGNQFWSQINATPDEAPGKMGQFGFSLASGDFDNDGKDDLAIGAPFDEVCPALIQTGKVVVMNGGSSGLSSQGSRTWDPTRDSLRGVPILNFRRFGYALATGDMNGDGLDDLAIGSDAGGVSVLFGNESFIIQSGFEAPPEWEFTGDPCSA